MSNFTNEVETPLSHLMPFMPFVAALMAAFMLARAWESGLRAWLRWTGRKNNHSDIGDPLMRQMLIEANLSPWPSLVDCVLSLIAAGMSFWWGMTAGGWL